MEYLKKYWYVALLLLGTVGLGLSTLFISLQLQQRSNITNQDSQAVTPECSLTFTISTDTPTPTPIPSDTPTPAPGSCNQACTSVFGCAAGLTCYNGFCRLPSCVEEPSCMCVSPTPTNTQTPSSTPVPSPTPTRTPTPLLSSTPGPSPTPTNTPTPGPSPTPTTTPTPGPSSTPGPSPTSTLTSTPTRTPTPAPGACNYTCSSNADCGNSYICSNGFCRNPQCTEQANCACYFVPTPKVPVTGMGTTILGIGVIAGGLILLLLGLAL